jgi:hypothetical protein
MVYHLLSGFRVVPEIFQIVLDLFHPDLGGSDILFEQIDRLSEGFHPRKMKRNRIIKSRKDDHKKMALPDLSFRIVRALSVALTKSRAAIRLSCSVTEVYTPNANEQAQVGLFLVPEDSFVLHKNRAPGSIKTSTDGT